MRALLLFWFLTVCALAQQPLRFSTANMDMTANPCADFYQYACGTCMAKNPIPRDQPAWGTFTVAADRNRAILRDILEKASNNNPQRSDVEQKIGDFYGSCMDEAAIEKLGLRPLDPHSDSRDRVDGVVGNTPEFREAFACHQGQPMVHMPACRVW